MKKIFHRKGSYIIATFVFGTLLLFLIWKQVIDLIHTDRSQAIRSAVRENSNIAVSLEQFTIRTIQEMDGILKLVKMNCEMKGKEFQLLMFLEQGIIDTSRFEAILILDENGKLKFTNNKSVVTVMDFSDREHFYYHKQNAGKLFISKPVVSRITGKHVIVISRRMNHPDGRFAGTVALQLEPNTFTNFYDSANFREKHIISLIAPDGITYARKTGNKPSFNEDISKSPLFQHLAKNPTGNYFAKDAIHQVPTYFSYRKLNDYPIIATVGSSEEEVLGNFRQRKQKVILFGVLITFITILFSGFIYLGAVERRKYIRRLRFSKIQYQSIFENSQDGIMVLSKKGQIESMNQSACHLFNVCKEDLHSLTIEKLLKKNIRHLELMKESEPYDFVTKEELVWKHGNETAKTLELIYSNFRDIRGTVKLLVLVRDISLRKQMEQTLLDEQEKHQQELTRQIIMAQERERETIGHELHDNVNQILTTVKLYLEMAQQNTDAGKELLPRSVKYIRECIDEIRNISRELSAPTLGTRSLIDSVNALVEMVESSSGLKINFTHEKYHKPISKEQKLAVYRILQEQLTNILKHSDASWVEINLSQHGDRTEVYIHDNGKGFNAAEKSEGIGLNNIRSRVKVFGGKVWIDSAPGQGCTLKASIPIIKEKKFV